MVNQLYSCSTIIGLVVSAFAVFISHLHLLLNFKILSFRITVPLLKNHQTPWEISPITAYCEGQESQPKFLTMFLFVYVNDTYVPEKMLL